jgi:hypothetical protein
MRDDRGDSRPKIDRPGLERIGRGLRDMYMKVPQDPLSPSMLLALRGIADAEHGLTRLKAAAQALRTADEPKKGKLHVAAWQASSGALRRMTRRRPA